jgi:hypothetical protein
MVSKLKFLNNKLGFGIKKINGREKFDNRKLDRIYLKDGKASRFFLKPSALMLVKE